MSIRDLNTKEITLSVGLTLKLSQSSWRIARKKDLLEQEAKDTPLPDPEDQLFAETFYPLLAAPVVSNNCPTLDECLSRLPEDDLETWYQACKELNPNWFVILDKIREFASMEGESDTETKKENLNPEETMPAESLTG